MFGDIVGSTELAEQVDHEEYREFLRAYYGICGDVVEHYEGHVAKHMGDGVLIYFGYPQAHADDARRAILAGLEIAAAVPTLDWMLTGEKHKAPSVRIGIHSGLTVVGDVGAGATYEALAVGETPNVAARLQQIAIPGEVVVSDATRALVDGFFDLQTLGAHSLKGVSEPMLVHRVIESRDNPQPLRLDRALFVGRIPELQQLRTAFADAASGEERVVSIHGEAGMGKSRLVEAFKEQVAGESVHWSTAACSPFFRNTAWYPVIQLLKAEANLDSNDQAGEAHEKLQGFLRRTAPDSPDTFELIASLLGVETGGNATREYPAEIRWQRTLEALSAVLRGLSSSEVGVVVVEDVHWADPSTLALITLLATQSAKSRLMMIVTHRPGVVLGATGTESKMIDVELSPLDSSDVELLIESLAAQAELSTEVKRDLISRADGVPIFVEALVKSIHDAASHDPTYAHDQVRSIATPVIPVTLRGLLSEQLDRLGSAKRVAQLAAMLGRRFSAELLDSLRDDSMDLPRELERLVRADVLVADQSSTTATFAFRHGLIQEAAYDSLLRSDRRRMHSRIATVFESSYPNQVEAHPEVIGHHWESALRHGRAAPYFRRAAERSALAYANEEALAFYAQSQESIEAVLANDGQSDEWRDMLRDVRERAGDIFTLRRRQDEAEAAYRGALGVCVDPVVVARLYRRIGVVHSQDRERAQTAFSLAEEALGSDGTERDSQWRQEWIDIQLARMRTHYWYGEGSEMQVLEQLVRPYIDTVATARQRTQLVEQFLTLRFRQERYEMSEESMRLGARYVDAAIELGDLTELTSARFAYGFCLVFGGQPGNAIEQFEAALDLTRRCGHRVVEIRCLAYLATAHRLSGNVEEAERFATTCLAEAMADQMMEYVGMAEGNLGWAALALGDRSRAEHHADRAIAAWDACAMAWPFRWIGLIVTAALAEDRGDLTEFARCARVMIDKAQQQLAKPLASELERCVLAVEQGEIDSARKAAQAALRVSGTGHLVAS